MTAPLGPDGFAAATGVSRETMQRLVVYASVLDEWCGRINLIGKSTRADVWQRHLLDSAQLLPLMPPGAASLVDLGSGAGLPGLVLAILGVPGVALVEADSRKCAFLHEAARATGTSVTIHQARAESLPRRAYDVVTARACAPLDRLLAVAEPFLCPTTVCLFPKGSRADEELTVAARDWKMTASRHQSRSDSRGVVLRLQQVHRESRHARARIAHRL